MCNCAASYEAWIYDAHSGQKIRRTFRGEGAKAAAKQVRRTLREEAEDWLAKAERGEITTRAGQPYQPSVLRGFCADYKNIILPDLGHMKMSDIRRQDVQAPVDRQAAELLKESVRPEGRSRRSR